jgi:hypothetical protein
MKKRVLASSILFSLTLVACGGSSSNDPADNADLQGTWVDVCEVDGEDSTRTEFSFTGNKMTQAVVTYLNTTNCDNDLTLTLGIDNTYEVDGSTTTLVDGSTAKNVNVVYGQAYYVGSDLVTAVLDSQGTSVAEIAASQGLGDIDNIPLAALGIEQEELYSIYRVSGDQLFSGDTDSGLSGNTPESRLNTLDTVDVLTRL